MTEEELSTRSTFPERLKSAIGGAYFPAMRRAVQTCVLLEANRCLESRYSVLRPFQRKIALYDTSVDIINTLDYIPLYHRISIMFRTASGKLPLSPELAWRRMKVTEKEIMKAIIEKLEPLLEKGISHEEVCEEFIKEQYDSTLPNSGTIDTEKPDCWEYTHLIPLLAYKMYYSGKKVNPNLAPAVDPNPHRVVPNKKPDVYPPELGKIDIPQQADISEERVIGKSSNGTALSSSDLSPSSRAAGERCSMLKEVREHLVLLKDFEGVISDAEIKKRKRELFKSLPPAPSVAVAEGWKINVSPKGYVKQDDTETKRTKEVCKTEVVC